MMRRGSGEGARRALWLWAAVGSAIAALPAATFEPLWILAFALPGAAVFALGISPLRHRLGYAELVVLALLLETALIFALLEFGRAPTSEAALTYTLLTPLTFLTLRRQLLDSLHALFLAFCVLLIGIILRGEPPMLSLAGFVLSATLVLQGEARLSARSVRSAVLTAPAAPRTRAAGGLAIAVASLLACAGMIELMRLAPSRDRSRSERTGAAQQAGLSQRFELAASSGNPLNLISDELVEVRSADGQPLPAEIYLRSGFFDVAHLDRWTVQPITLDTTTLGTWPLRPPQPNLRSRRLRVVRLDDCGGLMFMPPGTHEVLGNADSDARIRILHNRDAHFLQELQPTEAISYDVRYQDLRTLVDDRLAGVNERHLTRLPPALRSERHLRLADEWTRAANDTPATIARALVRNLQHHCTYALRDPDGHEWSALDNFLFGDRTGYCMHFATAMATMLRLQGVPCRIGVGLYGNADGRTDAVTLGSRHAHAWVEIPLVELGWVVFDPTPPAGLQSATGRFPLPAANTAPTTPDAETAGTMSLRDGRASPVLRFWPWLALVVLCGLSWLRPWRRTRTGTSAPPLTGASRSARRSLGRILHALARHGLPRPHGWSLERYVDSLHSRADDALEPLRAAFRAYQEVRFGGLPFDAQREAVIDAGLQAVQRLP